MEKLVTVIGLTSSGKSSLGIELAKKFNKTNMEGLELRSLKAGFAPNSVADSCRVVVNSSKPEVYDDLKENCGLTDYEIECVKEIVEDKHDI